MLPESLLLHTGEVRWARRPTQGGFYDVTILETERGRFVLKQGRPGELLEEFTVLGALEAYVPFVPAPVAHADGLFLLTCIEGETLLNHLDHAGVPERHHVVTEFAQALRQVHSWTPPLDRPADWLAGALERAARNVATGTAENPFSRQGPWNGKGPRDVLAYLQAGAPAVRQDLVFTHGDYCLPNVIMQGGRVTGVIDWSAGRYGDRRYDLAAGIRTIRHNLRDERYVETFLEAYGWAGAPEELIYFDGLRLLD